MASKSPDAFRTISEVADWLNTPAHVLRFWESKFSQVKPVKRAGGRRYYRPADMTLIGGIKKLLHDDGMTIKGVQKVLREHGIKYVSAMSPVLDDDLESLLDHSLDTPELALPPSPPATGQVLDFAGRATTETPAEQDIVQPPMPEAPQVADLFGSDSAAGFEVEAAAEADSGEDTAAGETESEETNLFVDTAPAPDVMPEHALPPVSEASVEEDEPSVDPGAEATDTIVETAPVELPEFLKKPMSQRLAEDEAEEDPALAAPTTAPGAKQPEPPTAPSPEFATSDPVPAAEADIDSPDLSVDASEQTRAPDIVSLSPEAAPQDPKPEATDSDPVTKAPDDAPSEPEPEVTPAAPAPTDPTAEPAQAPLAAAAQTLRPAKIDTPADPQDHDITAEPGPLSLLTRAETRAAGLSAEQIETLMIRVRAHQQSMSHAARN